MLDPPLIIGKASFVFHLAKIFKPKLVDKITPAGLSVRRRDHWESREQAAELLGSRGFYQHFDADCFRAYIEHALTHDPQRGGVTLTIPKDEEVAMFRTTPSMWWLPMPKPPVPVHLVVGSDSVFLKEKFPQVAKRKLAIPFSIVNGGHMFPLEHPRKTIEHVKSLII